jgi:hypothetical protein
MAPVPAPTAMLAFRRITVKTRLIADACGIYDHIDWRAALNNDKTQQPAKANEMQKMTHGVDPKFQFC